MGRWRVLDGDSLKVLTELDPTSMDAVVCDPPYGINFQQERWDGAAIRETATRQTGRRQSAGEAFQTWTTAWATGCLRAMKPGVHLLTFGSAAPASRAVSKTPAWIYGTR